MNSVLNRVITRNSESKCFRQSFPNRFQKRASKLLHSTATSKDILIWIPHGKLLRYQRIIPVRDISELVEYLLLRHNNGVAQPCALNTFLDEINCNAIRHFHK